ncbi:MAG: hypothetical protein ACI4T5_00505, partial [Prevotella sp.]
WGLNKQFCDKYWYISIIILIKVFSIIQLSQVQIDSIPEGVVRPEGACSKHIHNQIELAKVEYYYRKDSGLEVDFVMRYAGSS